MTQDEHETHIVSAFDKDLEALNALLMTLGTKAHTQLAAAVAVCRTGEAAAIADIIASDKQIDALEAELNEKVVEVIARRAPMAGDLRRIIAALKVAAALERIGDYAKNIAKRMRVILEAEAGAHNKEIAIMGDMVCAMLSDVMSAYDRGDEKLAIEIRNRDVEVDRLHTDIFRTLLTKMDTASAKEDSDHETSTILHFLFIAKNTERMGDYVTGIAEQIYFLKCGTLPDDDRPKADKSSTSI